ncbi:MAG: twin-arginine translocation signal domain-containing protein [Candidatus Acidiferrales bacterium]
MRKSKKSLVDRRNFLKGAAAGAAVLVANPRPSKLSRTSYAGPGAVPLMSRDAEVTTPPSVDVLTEDRSG